jgi:hypothetical protein
MFFVNTIPSFLSSMVFQSINCSKEASVGSGKRHGVASIAGVAPISDTEDLYE